MRNVPNRIEEHMTEYPSIASKKATVLEAHEFMQFMSIRHLPVVENGEVIGVISDRDLQQALTFSGKDALLTVEDVMTSGPYCVRVGTPLSEVAQTMASEKYGSTVVLNREGQVVGIFTTTDAMRVLSEILSSSYGAEAQSWTIEKLLTPNY